MPISKFPIFSDMTACGIIGRMSSIFEIIRDELIASTPKEYNCHLQFVHFLAKEFQKLKGGDVEVIEIAAIAHDYGRVPDGDNTFHAEIGAERIAVRLTEVHYDTEKTKHIARCVRMHNKDVGFKSIEEEIVMNADRLSKIAYFEAFMLMVKKESFQDRTKWAIKHLDQSYNKATFLDIRAQYEHMYLNKRNLYGMVL